MIFLSEDSVPVIVVIENASVLYRIEAIAQACSFVGRWQLTNSGAPVKS